MPEGADVPWLMRGGLYAVADAWRLMRPAADIMQALCAALDGISLKA